MRVDFSVDREATEERRGEVRGRIEKLKRRSREGWSGARRSQPAFDFPNVVMGRLAAVSLHR